MSSRQIGGHQSPKTYIKTQHHLGVRPLKMENQRVLATRRRQNKHPAAAPKVGVWGPPQQGRAVHTRM